jgi:di/tricarboxylate transporter
MCAPVEGSGTVVVVTELISNNAAAALAFPIALASAQALGASPTPFILVVAYAASAGFLLPFGYQTHMMVYSTGRYTLANFLKAGWPVCIVFAVMVLVLTPLVFPF